MNEWHRAAVVLLTLDDIEYRLCRGRELVVAAFDGVVRLHGPFYRRDARVRARQAVHVVFALEGLVQRVERHSLHRCYETCVPRGVALTFASVNHDGRMDRELGGLVLDDDESGGCMEEKRLLVRLTRSAYWLYLSVVVRMATVAATTHDTNMTNACAPTCSVPQFS